MTTTTTPCNDLHDRYAIDWELCSPPSTTRWAQLDTEADAAWFGQWVNPFRRIVLVYCEGELQVKRCDDDRELAAELHRIADWHNEHDHWKGIDPWNDGLARRLDDAGGRRPHPPRPKAAETTLSARCPTPRGQAMPDGTTSVNGPTAARGTHLELDLTLGDLLGSRIRTLIRAGETARQAAPADLHDGLKTITEDRTVRPQVRRLAVDLAGRIEDAMRRRPAANRITMTLERAEDR